MNGEIAKVLDEHQWLVGYQDMQWHCMCGWFAPMSEMSFSDHQAEALSAAGLGNVAPVRALHRSKALPYTLPHDQTCIHCGHPWPCPTTKALEGS